MKYAIVLTLVLLAVTVLTVLVVRGPIAGRWGEAGVRSLNVSAVICAIAAVLAAIPLGLTMTYWRQYAPQAAFGGTAVRLLVTGALALGYQTFADVHLTSFLASLLALYMSLLVVETLMTVLLVRRVFGKPTADVE